MALSVRSSEWQVRKGGITFTHLLSRTYYFSGLPQPDTTAVVKINCTLDSSRDIQRVTCNLRFLFRPFQIPEETYLILGLFTEDLKGGFVEAEAFPLENKLEEGDKFISLTMHDDDLAKCVRVLTAGKDMTFMLMTPTPPDRRPFIEMPPKPLVKLPLPNDLQFKRLYDQSYEEIEITQDATRARHLREGWYRRRTPGVDYSE